MKKNTGIFLFLCLIAPFLGSYCWLTISKQEIRNEVKRQLLSGMDREELVLLSFTEEENQKLLRWEHEGEFEFNGQMYDIVETEVRDGLISYWCWPDNKETILNNQIKTLVAKALGSHPQQKEQQKRLITFLQISYLPNHFNWHAVNPEQNSRHGLTRHYDCSSGFFETPVPPPENL